jgi:16S rRNA (adenine1518-N6/adenine1519-N6)-dimethyltransferase
MVNVRPKKRLGQHFLTDPAIAGRIADSLGNSALPVVELGPGKGILTRELLARPGINLNLVEIDDESIAYLLTHFPELQDRILHADFLRLDLQTLIPAEATFALIGNYPYNISSQILFRVWENRDRIPLMAGMFQMEVAKRVASSPGNKEYGILSVLLQTFFDIEYLFTVAPGSFFPPPKVKSGVIRLQRNNRAEIGVEDNLFKNLVKAGFNQRRKVLRNALSAYKFRPDPGTEAYFSMRAEQLSPDDWIALSKTTISLG